MRICGVELAASRANIVIVDAIDSGNTELVPCQTCSLELQDADSQDEVKSFKQAFQSLLLENHVEQVVVKKRSTKGDFAGGAVSFKIEGLIQLNDVCGVSLLSATAIANAVKKYAIQVPGGIFKYQGTAFLTAAAMIARSR